MGWRSGRPLNEPSAMRNEGTTPSAPVGKPRPESNSMVGSMPERGPLSRSLFSYGAPPSDVREVEARMESPTAKIHYVKVNADLFRAKSSPFWAPRAESFFEISLPASAPRRVIGLKTEVLGPQRYVVEGGLEGRPQSRVLVAFNQGAVAAQITDPDLGEFHLRTVSSVDGETGQLFQVDPERMRACGGVLKPSLSADTVQAWSMRGRMSAAIDQDPVAASEPRTAAETAHATTARLLFLYTNSVLAAYGSAAQVESVIDLAVAVVNSDLSNSQLSVRIQLAAARSVALSESSINYERTLNSLRGRTDGVLDQIHTLRDETYADLVTLGISANDTGNSLGIAYLIETPNDFVNSYFAFSVVQFGVMSSSNVLSHELGHNFGCAHDRENSDGQGAYPYSYGYRVFTQDSRGFNRQFRDIMAYAPGTRVPYFSNPRVKLTQANVGGSTVFLATPTAIGIEEGQPGEADNARTISQTAFEVSNYRSSPDAPYHLGTLVNVSTRAFVGTGAQQLIGGFVVGGAAEKTILVRAAGPALAGFGVSGALADPVLSVFRSSEAQPMAQNDNWGDQARPQDTLVLGFPFATGSRDAALLLSLAPGGYTAKIEGRDGATGIALVEAYEVERSGDKRLVNLSTRAYADTQRPMFAGFVIAPDPSSPDRTKRVLIRGLGPTLEGFGVSGVMGDPLMTLYDAAGQVMLENDDWDPPSINLGSGVVTTRGVVDQPSEKAIFDVITALNLPAMKPLEPALLVDLPPGSYTVMIRPFENEEQPAVPGVGLVEVYEVNPK